MDPSPRTVSSGRGRPPSYLAPAAALTVVVLALVATGGLGALRTVAFCVALPCAAAGCVLDVAARTAWSAGDPGRAARWSRAAGACTLAALVALPAATAFELAHRLAA